MQGGGLHYANPVEMDRQQQYHAQTHSSSDPRRLQKQKSIGGIVAENFFGVSSAPKVARVPPGYTVYFTSTGRPYLQKIQPDNDDEAAMEHKRIEFPMSVSREEMGERFGVGIYLYFDFLWFLCWTNFILVLLALGNFIPHLYYDHEGVLTHLHLNGFWSQAFLLTYISPDNLRPWRYTTIIAVVLWFLFGPVYMRRVKSYLAKNEIMDLEEMEVEDYIMDNQRITAHGRAVRLGVSLVISAVLLAVSAVVTAIIVALPNIFSEQFNELNSASDNLFTAAIVAVFLKCSNMAWQILCLALTKFEKHKTWSSFRTHQTLKYFIFKLLNVLIMYLYRFLSGKSSDVCTLNGLGDQFLFIIILDLTVQNLWEIFHAWFLRKVNENKGMKGTGSNEASRPEFDLADEYLEVLYRQFILYLGMPLFPLITLLGLICNILEYRLDKYRLLRICQHPRGMQASMKRFLVFFLFSTALVALVCYPFGTVWLLTGGAYKNCRNQLFSGVYNQTITS
eukprot:TRINITY_DN64_c0_g1_i1.p1 TRINITY_DN64_c0_g1~~TRINITY_DN64_c0_g1_i1.p1  ORF type:complete len:507 (-),score=82.41 TRINITY_DN64_c0_g1_i1:106-1626(-)